MKKIDFNYLSNSEIKIKLIELENEYNVCRNKIRDLMLQMNELDKNYTEGQNTLDKRTNGRGI